MDSKFFIKGRIARKLAISVILLSTFFSLFITIYQIYFDYQDNLKRIRGYAELIEDSYLEGVINALWTYDNTQVLILIDGIQNLPDMESVSIITKGKKIFETAPSKAKFPKKNIFPLLFNRKGTLINLGSMQVIVSFDEIYKRIFEKFLVVLVSNSIKTFIVAGFILFLFQYLITRHLNKVAKYLINLDIQNINTPFQLERKPNANNKQDELDEIVIAINSMIQNQHQAEEVLQASEGRYRDLYENAPNAYFSIDPVNGSILRCNLGASQLLGFDKETMLKMKVFDLYADTPHGLPKAQEVFKCFNAGETIRDVELHMKHMDGHPIWISLSVEALKDDEGNVKESRSMVIDISERKQAEDALRESEEKYNQLFTTVSDPIMLFDANTREFLDVNYAAMKLYGYTKEEFLNLNHRDITAEEEKSAAEIKQTLNGHLASIPIRYHRKKDGTEFPVEISTGVLKLEDRPVLCGVVRDISERKRAEEERARLEAKLQRTRKMESLGLMAGGIAHDLNNILSGIVSYPELLLMDLPEDSPLRKPIETIKDSGMRAADVAADLLTVARGVATSKEVSNLNTLVEEYLGSAEHEKLETFHSTITFKTDLDSDLLNIRCSPIHIKKSLTNLIANASEAIEGSGTVTISTGNRYLDEPLRGYEDVRKGEYAVLSVSDNGSGISANDLERIFEPFYTKKVMGRSGTGLGLAVVWNTIQDHDGYINVNTSEKGTVFELYFPVTRDEVAAEGEAVPVKDYMGHRERVLVVDDEKRQREIACGILTKLGYTAETVSSGEEAVEYLKEQSVDLVVLDMIMPKGINGCETYERIIKIHPGQKAIIASGYAETSDVKKAQRLGAGKYIKKPYTMGKIGVAVKKELEK